MNRIQYTLYHKALTLMLNNPEKFGYLEDPEDKIRVAQQILNNTSPFE